MFEIDNYKLNSEVYDNKLLKLNLVWMKYYGFIISSDQRYDYLHLTRCVLFLLSFIIATIFSFCKFGNGIINVGTSFTLLAISIALCNGFFHRAGFYKLIIHIHEDLKNILKTGDDHELQIYKATCKNTSVLSRCVMAVGLFVGNFFLINAIYDAILHPESFFNEADVLNKNSDRPLFVKIFPFREISDSVFVGYIFPSFVTIIGPVIVIPWHTFIIILMQYSVFRLKIINYRLQNMKISCIENFGKKKSFLKLAEEEKKIYKLVSSCVKDQNEVRRFVKELEKLISLPIFIDFIIFSVIICCVLYNFKGAQNKSELIFMLGFLCYACMVLWLYYWHANEIIYYSELTVFAAYSSEWYNFSKPLKDAIRVIMIGSLRPITMEPYFVRMNLDTFVYVLQAAYSYFNLLNSVNK